MKIPKHWTTLADQSVEEGGRVYKITDLIDRAKDLPVFEIPLDHLCIRRNMGKMRIWSFVGHMRQVMDADLDCPILLDEEGSILDGTHRVIKALYEGRETIKAKRFEEPPPATFVRN